MASISISASLPISPPSHYATKKQPPRAATQAKASSLGTEQETHIVTCNSEDHKQRLTLSQKEDDPLLLTPISRPAKDEKQPTEEEEPSAPKFFDKRWKNGTWDLNMFVKYGKMDWHALIFAEARRRRFLELYPEAATNEELVLFRSSIIPWWAWITHSHLAEAELLNGRAAMVGFFMSYMVDALTRLDVVGQTGNFVCKAALFITVIGIIIFRKREDFKNLQKLVDDATFYDKKWKASWQDRNDPSPAASD
ncbi:hypothetical protein ACH5RR_019513 [Cinchona calisaya]|uniref:Uncharacterized protein n=1 Tax=Cinchona calisaya TaxID=153742 RepID=A0ABD2ZPS2_9GENT